MDYKVFIYVIAVLISSFALSGLNLDSFMKKNKPLEARILVVILSCSLGYLLTSFIVRFIEASKIL